MSEQNDNGSTDVIESTAVELTPALMHRLDYHDEQQVLAEVKGKGLKKWAYEFSVGGQKVRGLSYAGVNGVVRDLNARGVARISCPPEPAPKFEDTLDDEGEPVYECLVYAQDELTGGGGWGLAQQRRFEQVHQRGCAKGRDCTCTPTERPDRFAKTKALSKAQRNAKKALIPEEFVAELVASLTSAQVERVKVENLAEGNGSNGRKAKPAAPKEGRQSRSPRAPGLDEELDKLMDALGYLPAKCTALVRSARTIKQKEALRDRLNAELEKAAA